MSARRRVTAIGILIVASLVTIVAFGIWVGFVELRFYRLATDIRPTEQLPQVWAHRGYHAGGAEPNSIPSVVAAEGQGFLGVELDLFWQESRLCVRHDRSDDCLAMSDVLAADGGTLSYYLDLKNLSPKNADVVAQHLRALLTGTLIERTFVESRRSLALSRLHDAFPELRLLYWLGGYDELGWWQRHLVRWRTVESGAGAVSIDHQKLGERFLSDFQHLRIHTFTVNDRAQWQALFDRGVDVLLTDLPLRHE